jgi:hypothetical protein
MKQIAFVMLATVSLISCKSVFDGKTLVYAITDNDRCNEKGTKIMSNNKYPELFHYEYERQYFHFKGLGDTCSFQKKGMSLTNENKVDSTWLYNFFEPYALYYDTSSYSWSKTNTTFFF